MIARAYRTVLAKFVLVEAQINSGTNEQSLLPTLGTSAAVRSRPHSASTSNVAADSVYDLAAVDGFPSQRQLHKHDVPSLAFVRSWARLDLFRTAHLVASTVLGPSPGRVRARPDVRLCVLDNAIARSLARTCDLPTSGGLHFAPPR